MIRRFVSYVVIPLLGFFMVKWFMADEFFSIAKVADAGYFKLILSLGAVAAVVWWPANQSTSRLMEMKNISGINNRERQRLAELLKPRKAEIYFIYAVLLASILLIIVLTLIGSTHILSVAGAYVFIALYAFYRAHRILKEVGDFESAIKNRIEQSKANSAMLAKLNTKTEG
jgi:hypothetical protein